MTAVCILITALSLAGCGLLTAPPYVCYPAQLESSAQSIIVCMPYKEAK